MTKLTQLGKTDIYKVAKGKQKDVAHLVLAWYLTRDSIDVVIPGVQRAEQVLDNLKKEDVQLTAEEVE